MKPTRIPLFPLELVLFPGMLLPLHIFEPRYRQMTRLCLDERREFGVVLAQPDGLAAVGTTAEIVKLTKTYPDGRMDILTAGRARFRATKVFQDQPYLEAEIEYLPEVEETPASEDDAPLRALFDRCHKLIYGRTQPLAPLPGVSLAYQVAAELPFDLPFRQALLEMRSEFDRRSRLLEHLSKWAPALEQAQRARRKAGGNGQGGSLPAG